MILPPQVEQAIRALPLRRCNRRYILRRLRCGRRILPMMGGAVTLDVGAGVSAKPASTTQTLTVWATGDTPKAVILWAGANATAEDTTTAGAGIGLGFSDGTNHWSSAIAMVDGAATTVAKKYHAAKALTLLNGDGTVLDSCTAAFTANTVTLTWGNSTGGPLIHYLALGGTDITNVKVGTYNADNTAGVRQVETATIVGTIVNAGNATITVTAAGMANSPKAISVAVAAADTASQVAAKVANALAADVDVNGFFIVSYPGSADKVALTVRTQAVNDGTMNIASANGTCTGLTAQPTSANTTAGTSPLQAVTGVGFKPTFLMELGIAKPGAPPSGGANAAMAWAAFNATGSSGVACSSQDNVTPTIGSNESVATPSGSFSAFTMFSVKAYSYTITGSHSLTSFDSDGFTVNWTVTPSGAHYIGYLAMAGTFQTYITNAQNVTATGDTAFSGFGFTPVGLFVTSLYPDTDSNNASFGASAGAAKDAGACFADFPIVTTEESDERSSATYMTVLLNYSGSPPSLRAAIKLKTFDAGGITVTADTLGETTPLSWIAFGEAATANRRRLLAQCI